MINKKLIDMIEKYSFVDRIEYGTNFYVKIFYKIKEVEKHKSISRRASDIRIQELIETIKNEADIPEQGKMEDDLPIEILKYRGDNNE